MRLLPAATGNLGKPGAGFLYLNGYQPARSGGRVSDRAALGDAPPPISHMDLAEVWPTRGVPQALICWNINVAASGPRQRQLREAMLREDLFTVAIDLFQTDTCDSGRFHPAGSEFPRVR